MHIFACILPYVYMYPHMRVYLQHLQKRLGPAPSKREGQKNPRLEGVGPSTLIIIVTTITIAVIVAMTMTSTILLLILMLLPLLFRSL